MDGSAAGPAREFQGFSQALAEALDAHAQKLKYQVAERAFELASAEKGSDESAEVTIADLNRALEELKLPAPPTAPSRLEKWFRYFSPFTCVCAILCIVVALIGWRAGSGNNAGFLDIAKIFAGAIVGATTNTAISKPR